MFCLYFNFPPIPANSELVCLYAQFLSRTLTPPSIRNYLSGVKLMHIFVNADYSFSKDFILSLTLRGISRAALHTPIRAPPVNPSLLLRVARTLNYRSDRLHCTLHCAFLFSFFLMARLANIVPSSKSAFDYKRHLTRGDVAFSDTGLLVTFKCTKTIQFGERRLQIPLLRIDGSPLQRTRAWFSFFRLILVVRCLSCLL